VYPFVDSDLQDEVLPEAFLPRSPPILSGTAPYSENRSSVTAVLAETNLF